MSSYSIPPATSSILPAVLIRHEQPGVTFRQRFTPGPGNLQFLTCGEFDLPGRSESQSYCLADRESLLFMWKGSMVVEVAGRDHCLGTYDTLYVPRGAAFRLRNEAAEPARAIQCTAPAENAHPVFHSRFAEMSADESRIRRLKGKNVYLMFDVGEKADKLVAGYTFFEPYARSWPPHNHTDQEEVYVFIKGKGSMEVYESPETLTFVHNVNEGDMVTIPFLNYHPVFSQEEPLEFIWCIAGERYWVGDKNKDFMKGTADSITT
ncbi:MAG: 5-deoxy-glucuronate isomerase [Acidobacteria bacterium]|nr:5-deoxy-glucuronate isomerase [Acidobacteriota bacterium]